MIAAGSLVLFQGDSITDAARSREIAAPNAAAAMGHGYALLVMARLLADRPADGLRFLNRGISGHRVVDLYARWKVDAINLAPDLLSILIGVNDTWHELGESPNGVEPDRYARVYRMLLDLTRERLPRTRLVLCEPFVLRGSATEENWDHWREEVAARAVIVRELAGEYGAGFVPFQAAMDAASAHAPAAHWTGDGVHPTAAGAQVLADAWIRAVEGVEG